MRDQRLTAGSRSFLRLVLPQHQTAAIQKQIDETQDVMRENIQRVAERGERLDALQDKTCVAAFFLPIPYLLPLSMGVCEEQ